MPIVSKYVHTNLTGRDWRKLARFYCDVFGCVPRLPERNLRGEWLDRLTSIHDAHLTGMHLTLPGYGDDGPTLEIFSYDTMTETTLPIVNEAGFGHLAFAVADVAEALAEVRANGGSAVGSISRNVVPGVGTLHVVYARDPEGNIIELQNWSKKPEE